MSYREEKEELCDCRIIHAERIEAARQNSLNENDQGLLSNLFKAMGDPTRLKIMQALRLGEMCVCDLAALLNSTLSAVSHQLRLLRTSGLVRFRKEGKMVYYSLADARLAFVLQEGQRFMTERKS